MQTRPPTGEGERRSEASERRIEETKGKEKKKLEFSRTFYGPAASAYVHM